MTVFKGLYKAIYNYDPLPENSEEELGLTENDILYLLNETPSEDEGWWLVKKRLVGVDLEEPIGLVPNNYLEDISNESLYQVTALYDYDQLQNDEEELSFKEGDKFDVIDDNDADWLLVKNVSGEFGFIPGNYVEKVGIKTSVANSIPISSFAPPPVRFDREEIVKQVSNNNNSQTDFFQPPPKHKSLAEKELPKEPEQPVFNYSSNIKDQQEEKDDDDFYEQERETTPPPKPTRPTQNTAHVTATNTYTPHETEDFMSWNVQEIINRSKKVKAKLTLGNTIISFVSENSPNGQPEEWPLSKLVSYDLEKKHLFLDFVSPSASLELHTGTTANGREIFDRLSEIKGSYSSKSLDQIKKASTVSPERQQKLKENRMAKVIIDFSAKEDNELTIKTGDKVYVLNDSASDDWTLVELVSAPGKKGVVPSQFIESVNQLSSVAHSHISDVSSRSRSSSSAKKTKKHYNEDNEDETYYENSPKKESKTKKLIRSLTGKKSESNTFNNDASLKPQKTGSWKDDSNQNVNSKSGSSKKSRSNSQSRAPASTAEASNLPNMKKVRSWVDTSATFKVDAELIGASQGKIHLHKTNGVKIAVPAEKLSLQDLEFVERSTGFSLDKYKPKKQESSKTYQEPQQQYLDSQATGSKDKERERRRKIKEKEDREVREREVDELRRARQMLDQERAKLREEKERDFAKLKELQMSKELPAPAKPPRPQKTGGDFAPVQKSMPTGKSSNLPYYDWFEFFLSAGVDVNNCQRYTINFEREDITEDILPAIDSALLRSLGLKEGDILRVIKFLDIKFGRNEKTKPVVSDINDNNWASKPTIHTKKSVDSIQDLLDLKPTNTGVQTALVPKPSAAPVQLENKTGIDVNNLVPLNPFKTGGTNVLPMTILPMITGGMMTMPQTSFGSIGLQPIGRTVTGGMILPLQKTGGGLMPATSFGQQQGTGGLIPQTSFGQSQITGGYIPQTSFGQPQITGGFIPQTSFGQPQLNQFTGGMQQPQLNQFMGSMQQPQLNQFTGSMQQPQLNQFTGGMQQPQLNQFTGGMQQPQLNQFTGSMQQPQQMQMTGGFMPQTSFSQPQKTNGFVPQSTFGMNLQQTGGIAPIPQTSFGASQSVPNLANLQNNSNMNIYNHSQPQLQQQPTGFGFGNAPAIQPQRTSQQANLNNASASNPFGF
ncbi:hypothetical protein QEN19_002169 [Hanseniaspora menglaensis]